MGYTVVKPRISTTGRIKSHGIHFIFFCLLSWNFPPCSSSNVKQTFTSALHCCFFISFTYTYLHILSLLAELINCNLVFHTGLEDCSHIADKFHCLCHHRTSLYIAFICISAVHFFCRVRIRNYLLCNILLAGYLSNAYRKLPFRLHQPYTGGISQLHLYSWMLC